MMRKPVSISVIHTYASVISPSQSPPLQQVSGRTLKNTLINVSVSALLNEHRHYCYIWTTKVVGKINPRFVTLYTKSGLENGPTDDGRILKTPWGSTRGCVNR